MAQKRRLPAPWRTVETPSGYKVIDANGVAIAYCYAKDEREASTTDYLSWDEARRVASAIAKLPKLLDHRVRHD